MESPPIGKGPQKQETSNQTMQLTSDAHYKKKQHRRNKGNSYLAINSKAMAAG